jgi:hypothetical protein
MPKLRVDQDIGHRGAVPLMAPRWRRVLLRRGGRSRVGLCTFSGGLRPYRTTGPTGRQPGTQASGSGKEYSGRSRRWRCSYGIGYAAAFLPGESAPAASAEFREHS